MRCTYMYSFKCGAMERNEVDLDWIYIDMYGWLRIGKTRRRGGGGRKEKKLWKFVWGGKNVKVGIYLGIA